MKTKQDILWAEIQKKVTDGKPLPQVIYETVAEVRRQRDLAFERLTAISEEIESHREFWRRSKEEIDNWKTEASRSYHRAERLEAQVREKREGYRRVADAENARLRAIIDHLVMRMRYAVDEHPMKASLVQLLEELQKSAMNPTL